MAAGIRVVCTYDEAELVFGVIKSNSTEYHCTSLIAWNDGSTSRCIKELAVQTESVCMVKAEREKKGESLRYSN